MLRNELHKFVFLAENKNDAKIEIGLNVENMIGKKGLNKAVFTQYLEGISYHLFLFGNVQIFRVHHLLVHHGD